MNLYISSSHTAASPSSLALSDISQTWQLCSHTTQRLPVVNKSCSQSGGGGGEGREGEGTRERGDSIYIYSCRWILQASTHHTEDNQGHTLHYCVFPSPFSPSFFSFPLPFNPKGVSRYVVKLWSLHLNLKFLAALGDCLVSRTLGSVLYMTFTY